MLSSSLNDGVYRLRNNDSLEEYQVYCHMSDIPGTGPGGWTLVMKINGNKVKKTRLINYSVVLKYWKLSIFFKKKQYTFNLINLCIIQIHNNSRFFGTDFEISYFNLNFRILSSFQCCYQGSTTLVEFTMLMSIVRSIVVRC